MSLLPLPRKATLKSVVTGEAVDATVVRLSEMLAKRIDEEWWLDVPHNLRLQPHAYDPHWRWLEKWNRATSPVDPADRGMIEAVCVITSDSRIQGAATFRLNFTSVLQEGRPAVGLEFVATAPWNRRSLTPEPQFSQVGSVLVLHAVYTSYLLGLAGVVVAAAIDSTEALSFYSSRGFVDTGKVTEDELSLPYWELSPDHAKSWLRAEELVP